MPPLHHYISRHGHFRIIWMGLWQFFAGIGCGDYGRFVVWFGPVYIAIGRPQMESE